MTVDDPASQQQQRMKRAKDDSPENAQNHNTQGQMDVEYSAIIAQQQSPATPSKRRRTTNQIELIPIELPTKPIVSSLPFVPRTPCKPRYAAALAPKPDPPGTGPFKQTEKNLWEFNQTLQSLSVKLNLDGDSQNLISCLLHKCLESAEGLGIDCTRPFMQPSALLAVLIWFVDRLVAQNSMGSGISLSQLLITTNITYVTI
jgi:hypothetical protein